MKALYLECNMGAAGDMLMAALLELHPQPDAFVGRLNQQGIPGVFVEREKTVKCGITGTHISVRVEGEEEESMDVPAGHSHHDHNHDRREADHGHGHHPHSHDHDDGNYAAQQYGGGQGHHHHRGLADIVEILDALPVSKKVKRDVLAVYGLIAEAESAVHGEPVEAVHFHEVGAMDAVTDILGVCLLMEELAPQRVLASPVHVGSGQVKCAHGILPVPAPATAYILKGVPSYGGQIRGELCTPTGAALLKHFAQDFGDRPMMTTEAIGYGMGKKDFPVANCLRAFLGEDEEKEEGHVVELVCNLDDMTGEELGFALEILMERGALDAYIAPIQMKKGRPGHMLACLCKPEDEEELAALMLKHTTTFGVRSSDWRRRTLARSLETAETVCGPVRVKTGNGYGVTKSKAEYADLAKLAKETGASLAEIRKRIEQ